MTAFGNSPAVEAARGRTVGRYQLLEPLGRGGMGTVYRARQVQLEKLVAVKVLDPMLAGRQDGVTRFLREARAAAQIRHPNVVEVFDVGFDDGSVYLAMELLEGQDLAALLAQRRPLAVHEIVAILAPVLAGVRAAHEAGVVHRDLKPSNIFLARRGRTLIEPVVLDFGVSRVLEDDELGLTPVTDSQTMIGTAAYIAPEQAKRARMADARSDQYSLAVILYECATGIRPFAGQSTYELLHSIATATVQPPSRLNPALPSAFDEIVLRALSRDPDARYADLDGFARALMAFASPRTWAAWGRELAAAEDAAPVNPLSSVTAAPSLPGGPLAAQGPPAPRGRAERHRVLVAFLLGALLAGGIAAATRVERLTPASTLHEAPSSTTGLVALLSSALPAPSGVLRSPPEPVRSATRTSVGFVVAAKPRVASRLATASELPRAPSVRPGAPVATSTHIELGPNDAPILK